MAGSNRINKVGTQAMAFDAAGNLSSYAGKTFTHGAGVPRTTTTGAGTVTYQYDGLGRRVSKSGPTTLVPGGFVRYVLTTPPTTSLASTTPTAARSGTPNRHTASFV
ncbi:MAG: hypothetical protein R3E34_10285 [Rhodocyclaceae bacterium]